MKKKRNIPLTILKFILIAIAVILIAGILIIVILRSTNYMHHKIQLQNGVNETTYLDINGQEQYVMMMGQDTSNPVIIYLHGGPAGPDTFITYSFTDYLTDEYTVISWDQRGCGRTYYKNVKEDPDNETASFDQALKDLDELVSYACDRFGQNQVIIMGHSYGTVLGSVYAKLHPEKVKAYIGIGQLVSLNDADIYSYNDALAKAMVAGDDTSEMENAYKEYLNNPGIPTLLALRNLTSKYHPVSKEADQIGLALFSPYAGIDDIRWFAKQLGDIDEFVALNKQLFDYVLSFDAYNEPLEYQMPICFIQGSEDWICPTDKASEYLDALDAPYKELYVIDECGHDVQCADPEHFSTDVKEFLDKI
jgi:pimeloyl-ACP methyl ester carboxylesterase